jgi:hypothetical protein
VSECDIGCSGPNGNQIELRFSASSGAVEGNILGELKLLWGLEES